MAEEEIVLRVRLEDLATPKLRQINREIVAIGGGPNNLPRLRRDLAARKELPPLREALSGYGELKLISESGHSSGAVGKFPDLSEEELKELSKDIADARSIIREKLAARWKAE
jgi:hypothetical protein